MDKASNKYTVLPNHFQFFDGFLKLLELEQVFVETDDPNNLGSEEVAESEQLSLQILFSAFNWIPMGLCDTRSNAVLIPAEYAK